MSLSEEERRIVVHLELEKANRIFSQIEALRTLGYWDNIANRLYYALFHAVSALLIHDGHNVSTHKGVVVAFGQHYIRTGVFPLADGKLYSQLQTIREKSDYNCTYDMQEKDLLPLIAPSKLLIEKIAAAISNC